MLLFKGKILDRQLDKRPQTVKYCTKCVVSNQRPRITFNADGVCSACQFAHRKHNEFDWKAREAMLVDLLNRHRSKDGSYDVIVPGSGGKDSAYVAHQLKYKYGMHPLTVTWAPFLYTDIGWKNYLDFKDRGFDNLLCFPDGIIHRKLARVAFELLGDAWEPFNYGQKPYSFHIACKFKIPLIFYGESGEAEYGGTTSFADKPKDPIDAWKDIYFKGSGVHELVEHGLKVGLFTSEEVKSTTFPFYQMPSQQQIDALQPEMHWFSFYKKWIPQENYYYAVENTGFQANPDGRSEGTYSKYASLDDKTDGFHFYLAFIKFGIGRATSDAAHEIRDGHLTREEGMALVHRYDGEFPKKYFKEFLEYLNITEADFWDVVNHFRELSPHLWEKRGSEWILKQRVS